MDEAMGDADVACYGCFAHSLQHDRVLSCWHCLIKQTRCTFAFSIFHSISIALNFHKCDSQYESSSTESTAEAFIDPMTSEAKSHIVHQF